MQEALFVDSGRLTLSIAGGTLFKSDKAFGRTLINIYGFLPVIAYFYDLHMNGHKKAQHQSSDAVLLIVKT